MRVRAKWWVRGAPPLSVTVLAIEDQSATVLVDGYSNSDLAALIDLNFERVSLNENPCTRATCKRTGEACPQ